MSHVKTEEYQALIKTIVQSPFDTLPKLVLADWLDEYSGDGKELAVNEAEYIRDGIDSNKEDISFVNTLSLGSYPSEEKQKQYVINYQEYLVLQNRFDTPTAWDKAFNIWGYPLRVGRKHGFVNKLHRTRTSGITINEAACIGAVCEHLLQKEPLTGIYIDWFPENSWTNQRTGITSLILCTWILIPLPVTKPRTVFDVVKENVPSVSLTKQTALVATQVTIDVPIDRLGRSADQVHIPVSSISYGLTGEELTHVETEDCVIRFHRKYEPEEMMLIASVKQPTFFKQIFTDWQARNVCNTHLIKNGFTPPPPFLMIYQMGGQRLFKFWVVTHSEGIA